MATRRELIEVVGRRYRASPGPQRRLILDEFVRVTGYHRKHAIRVLRGDAEVRRPRVDRKRHYDQPVQDAVTLLWEAADRICGKRLKALLPTLIEAMSRHGHLELEPAIAEKLACVSAATVDRMLAAPRERACAGRRRRSGVGSAIRKSVPVRTFADWNDPAVGFFEVDMVEHCGGSKRDGNFVHSLVLTDIATGWTECVALLIREQNRVAAGLCEVRGALPFAMLGIDTDNDSAFMTQPVVDFCKEGSLHWTRSRAYKKKDQAWVEQQNGAVVRRLVGYGRLSGPEARAALARLYDASRLYVNFFQPCFKLKSKQRDGARVHKTYHPPATPYQRVLDSDTVSADSKRVLTEQFQRLDPVGLLGRIRHAQQALAGFAQKGEAPAAGPIDVSTFLAGLSIAWESGEARPTHRTTPTKAHWWRAKAATLRLLGLHAHLWNPEVERWLHRSAADLEQANARHPQSVATETASAPTRAGPCDRQLATPRGSGLLQLPRSPGEQPPPERLPKGSRSGLAARPSAAWAAWSYDLGQDAPVCRSLPSPRSGASPISERALRGMTQGRSRMR